MNRGNDLTEFFWPIYLYVKNQILATHKLPYWNGMFLSGVPLLPDPQSPIFYLPNIIFMVLPIGVAFIISSIIHTAFGGIGTYLVCYKGLKFKLLPSLFGSFAYLHLARYSGFIEAGHFGLIAATTYIPYVFLSLIMISRNPSLTWSVIFASSLAGIFFTHPTTFVYAALFSFPVFFTLTNLTRRAHKTWLFYIIGGLISFGFTAITLLPQLNWVPQTNRFLLSVDKDVYPKWNSIGEYAQSIFAPWLNGISGIRSIDSEKWLFIGILPSILAVYGFTQIKTAKKKVCIMLLLFTFALFSLNNLSPFYTALLNQNWYVFGRVSTRVWFMVSFPIILLATYAINVLSTKHTRLAYILAMLAVVEITTISLSHITKPIRNDRLIASKNVLSFLANDKDRFRVFCTTRCFSQKDVAEYGLETIEGYSTLHQKNYYQSAWGMTGAYWNYYTLTLPPIGSYKYGKLDPNYESLGNFNTKYIVSPYEIVHSDIVFLTAIDGFNIYSNNKYKPRGYFVENDKTQTADIKYYSPNKIVINVNTTSKHLILAEVFSPGWIALADTKKVQVQETPNAQRAIDLPLDTKMVELYYQPVGYNLGKTITVATLIGLSFYVLSVNLKKIKLP
ncbi:hypothetical protein IPM62_04445 [Candidatus Woesebacteria bacterium]|nr:MAG: hypothetical protein IPM62_04445 [Candidatus Woesebacteria bacterium]